MRPKKKPDTIANLRFDLMHLGVCRHPHARRQPTRYRSRRRPLAWADWSARDLRGQQFRWFAPRITAPLLAVILRLSPAPGCRRVLAPGSQPGYGFLQEVADRAARRSI